MTDDVSVLVWSLRHHILAKVPSWWVPRLMFCFSLPAVSRPVAMIQYPSSGCSPFHRVSWPQLSATSSSVPHNSCRCSVCQRTCQHAPREHALFFEFVSLYLIWEQFQARSDIRSDHPAKYNWTTDSFPLSYFYHCFSEAKIQYLWATQLTLHFHLWYAVSVSSSAVSVNDVSIPWQSTFRFFFLSCSLQL